MARRPTDNTETHAGWRARNRVRPLPSGQGGEVTERRKQRSEKTQARVTRKRTQGELLMSRPKRGNMAEKKDTNLKTMTGRAGAISEGRTKTDEAKRTTTFRKEEALAKNAIGTAGFPPPGPRLPQTAGRHAASCTREAADALNVRTQ